MIEYFRELFTNVFTPRTLLLLLEGTQVTVTITLLAGFFGLLLGLLSALGRMSRVPLLRPLAIGYVEFFRGTPLLVQLFIIWFGLPELPFVDWNNAYQAGAVGLSLYAGAYFSEIIRGAFNAVAGGQREAAQVLGLRPLQTFRFVLLPQALRNAIPALGNQFISLIKDSTLVAVITVPDLLYMAQNIGSRTFRFFPVYLGIALIYLMLSNIASLGVAALERYYDRPYRQAR